MRPVGRVDQDTLGQHQNLLQESMLEGDARIEFSSPVTKPDQISLAPFGTCWSVKTRTREIERREEKSTDEDEAIPTDVPGEGESGDERSGHVAELEANVAGA